MWFLSVIGLCVKPRTGMDRKECYRLTHPCRKFLATPLARRGPQKDIDKNYSLAHAHTHTHTRLTAVFPGLLQLLICNVIWQNLVLLSLVNIAIDVTCLISGINTNLRTFLCKTCDVGYDVINRDVNRCLQKKMVLRAIVFISISLLRKILKACQN